MSDIDVFISYKREERGLADQVSRALKEAGYVAVTDRDIQEGEDYGDAIDRMIGLARLVIVLWSKSSVTSKWVKTEAREAARLDKYFGVRLDDVASSDLPMAVRYTQVLDLTNLPQKRIHERILERVQIALPISSEPAGVSAPETGPDFPNAPDQTTDQKSNLSFDLISKTATLLLTLGLIAYLLMPQNTPEPAASTTIDKEPSVTTAQPVPVLSPDTAIENLDRLQRMPAILNCSVQFQTFDVDLRSGASRLNTKIADVPAGQRFQVLAQKPVLGQYWFQIQVGDRIGWVQDIGFIEVSGPGCRR